MRKASLLLITFFLFPNFGTRTAQCDMNDELWENYENPADLQIEYIEIHCARTNENQFKKNGPNTLGGPGYGMGTSNFIMDAYTAPTWASIDPSVFSIEKYSFSGGAGATVDHRIVVTNNAGPQPTPLSLAFAWQCCGNSVLIPPLPSLVGTTIDGMSIFLTLPFSGIWYITVGVGGFSPILWPCIHPYPLGYDWMVLANYDGITPIPVPPHPSFGTDFYGGMSLLPYRLYDYTSDVIGDGQGSARPWCFETH